ncbi:MAG: alanine:cation symporter family protein, partial [Oribacterium sp.]
DLVWDMADFFNGLMVIPNVLALLKLGSVVVNTRKLGKG